QEDCAELRSRQAIVTATLGIPGRFWAFHPDSPRQSLSLPCRLWTTTLIQPFAIARAWHKLLLTRCHSSPAPGIASLSSCSLVKLSQCKVVPPNVRCLDHSHVGTSPGRIYIDSTQPRCPLATMCFCRLSRSLPHPLSLTRPSAVTFFSW
ncbi:hypothetical protein CCUS01_12057, partial [Colletotrichum cuscutae]